MLERIPITSTKIIIKEVVRSKRWPCHQVHCFIKLTDFFMLIKLLFKNRTDHDFFVFMILAMSTRRVRPVDMNCLLLLGTWCLIFLEVNVALPWICIMIFWSIFRWLLVCFWHCQIKIHVSVYKIYYALTVLRSNKLPQISNL